MAAKWRVILITSGLLAAVALGQGDERPLMEAACEGDKLIDRLEALEAVLSASDPEQRIEVLRYVESFLTAARSAAVNASSSVEATRRVQGLHIVHHFIDKCTGFLAETPEGKRELTAMLLRVCETKDPMLAGETYLLAYERLMKLAESDAERMKYALGFIEQENHAAGWQVVRMLNERRDIEDSTLQRLRAICLDSLANGRANYLALEVLGHHGDREILDQLSRHRDRLAGDTRSSLLLRNATIRIEIQHPPARLLDYLRSGSAEHGVTWMVVRAAQLGFPDEELRGAVLQYYARCPKEQLRSFRLGGLDRAVTESGILSESELPAE